MPTFSKTMAYLNMRERNEMISRKPQTEGRINGEIKGENGSTSKTDTDISTTAGILKIRIEGTRGRRDRGIRIRRGIDNDRESMISTVPALDRSTVVADDVIAPRTINIL